MSESEQEPDLEDALDGIMDATIYCESRGLMEESEDLGEIYQRVGRLAPDEDWTVNYEE